MAARRWRAFGGKQGTAGQAVRKIDSAIGALLCLISLQLPRTAVN